MKCQGYDILSTEGLTVLLYLRHSSYSVKAFLKCQFCFGKLFGFKFNVSKLAV